MRKISTMIKLKILKSGLIVFGIFFITVIAHAADINLKNPLGINDPNILIGKIIASVLGFVGTLALVMFIYGGFTWMLSGGSPDKVKKGRDIFVWATLGLVMIFSSYIIVKFIFDLLKK